MIHTAETLQAAFKYLFVNEVPTLKELARSLPDNPVIINIGAGAGTSGLAFMESREDLWLITIDKEGDPSPFGSLHSEEIMLREANLWGVNVRHILGDSYSTGMQWLHSTGEQWLARKQFEKWPPVPFVQVDMVFIDGDHSYKGCKGDIKAWLPNIKPGGIIAVHDYKKKELYAHDEDYKDDAPHPQPWPGVDKAVDGLLTNTYEKILRVDSLIAFRV